MNKKTLRMQMLAGIITEGQYKEKIEENKGKFKSLNFEKLATLFQILVKIPANAETTTYNMDTGKSTKKKEGIVDHNYVTPKFFKKLKDLQSGLQKGDKEAGDSFNEFLSNSTTSRNFPFNLYSGEKDLFMPADYQTLDDLNEKFDDMADAVQFTSEYEEDDINVANPEWNNFVDAVNNVNLDNFKKYIKK